MIVMQQEAYITIPSFNLLYHPCRVNDHCCSIHRALPYATLSAPFQGAFGFGKQPS